MERTNIRYVTLEDIGEPLDFASIDVSFISLKLVLPVSYKLLKSGGEITALIKPQFEAGKDQVGKKGVVRDKSVHFDVLRSVLTFAEENGFAVCGLTFSPVKGPEGNIEYLAYLVKDKEAEHITDEQLHKVVEASHEELDKNN